MSKNYNVTTSYQWIKFKYLLIIWQNYIVHFALQYKNLSEISKFTMGKKIKKNYSITIKEI